MKIDDRKARHTRAVTLFEAEAREQQLSAIALTRAATGAGEIAQVIRSNRAEPPGPAETQCKSGRAKDLSDKGGDPVAGLHTLSRAAEARIIDAHHQLQSARVAAARMAAVDPELVRLNALIDGTEPIPPDLEGNIIEGEVVEVAGQGADLPRRLNQS